MTTDTEGRVDGRELVELDEPGSDDRLLSGLLRALGERLGDRFEEEEESGG
jgi:hypothetical protein